MTSGFRILEHPADLGIEAWGTELGDAFRQAALALVSIVVDPSSIRTSEERMVSVTGSDIENLLVRWLSEILYLADGEDFLVSGVEVVRLKESAIEARLIGEKLDLSRHRLRTDVKAVTYHQLSVGERDGIWTATVYLDI